MSRLLDRLLSLLYPHKCFCCGRIVADDAYLCDRCAGSLPLAGPDCCPGCGKPWKSCACGQEGFPFDRAAAPLLYSGGVRRGIHSYKYNGRSYYAPFLARWMAEALADKLPDVSFGLMVYVPLHRKKQRQRGYCQTGLLARELSALTGIPVEGGLLAHTGKGKAQMRQKSLEGRRDNAARSFVLRPGAALHGETVLLVDDVFTTGSTAARCAALLREAGAGRVCVLTAATTGGGPAGKLQAGRLQKRRL